MAGELISVSSSVQRLKQGIRPFGCLSCESPKSFSLSLGSQTRKLLRCFLWVVSQLANVRVSLVELAGSVVGGGSKVDEDQSERLRANGLALFGKSRTRRTEDLGLGLESAEGRTVDDSISICLKRRTIVIRFASLEAFSIKAPVETVLRQ